MPAAALSRADPSSRPGRDLVAAIRAELASVDPVRACCREAELVGLASGPRRPTTKPGAARLAVRLAGLAGDRPPRPSSFVWDAAEDHCRIAYLRGCFLARGSLSLAGDKTHLEFVVPVPEARVLGARLTQLGLPGVVRLRRGAGVVTWKSTESVLTFLRRAGATGSALELEARLVARNLRAQLNRVVNAESANLRRQVVAAARQLEAIEELDGDGRLAGLPEAVRTVAQARRSAPEASFSDLAGRVGLSRSLVQRALERLEHLAFSESSRLRRRR